MLSTTASCLPPSSGCFLRITKEGGKPRGQGFFLPFSVTPRAGGIADRALKGEGQESSPRGLQRESLGSGPNTDNGQRWASGCAWGLPALCVHRVKVWVGLWASSWECCQGLHVSIGISLNKAETANKLVFKKPCSAFQSQE